MFHSLGKNFRKTTFNVSTCKADVDIVQNNKKNILYNKQLPSLFFSGHQAQQDQEISDSVEQFMEEAILFSLGVGLKCPWFHRNIYEPNLAVDLGYSNSWDAVCLTHEHLPTSRPRFPVLVLQPVPADLVTTCTSCIPGCILDEMV